MAEPRTLTPADSDEYARNLVGTMLSSASDEENKKGIPEERQ